MQRYLKYSLAVVQNDLPICPIRLTLCFGYSHLYPSFDIGMVVNHCMQLEDLRAVMRDLSTTPPDLCVNRGLLEAYIAIKHICTTERVGTSP